MQRDAERERERERERQRERERVGLSVKPLWIIARSLVEISCLRSSQSWR